MKGRPTGPRPFSIAAGTAHHNLNDTAVPAARADARAARSTASLKGPHRTRGPFAYPEYARTPA